MEAALMIEKLTQNHPGAVLAARDRYGDLEIQVAGPGIAEVLKNLRDDPEFNFDMLVDLVSIDYSLFAGWSAERFGLVYLLKSMGLRRRLRLKVMVPEENPSVPTASSLYANANWLEREAFDQMGIRFAGHPNLKRLLNHHEFVGHPLRKDYPITRRQGLSANESLMEEMDERLREKGYA
jgi:NADH:ubiquinone oxidoreductase subunit C